MKGIGNLLETITLPKGITVTDFNCEIHPKVQLLNINGVNTCSRCTLEAENKKLEAEAQEDFEAYIRGKKKRVFDDESLVPDDIKKASFKTYKPTTEEAKINARTLYNYMKKLTSKSCENFNVIVAGNCGSGKSHLTYALAKACSESGKEVMFITIGKLLRKVKASWSKDTPFTEDDIISRLGAVEILVLDDLGAELGALDSDSKATNFMNRVLFDVMDARQGKTTIFTTNLTEKRIEEAYDERIVDRIFNEGHEIVVFKDTESYRRRNNNRF